MKGPGNVCRSQGQRIGVNASRKRLKKISRGENMTAMCLIFAMTAKFWKICLIEELFRIASSEIINNNQSPRLVAFL